MKNLENDPLLSASSKSVAFESSPRFVVANTKEGRTRHNMDSLAVEGMRDDRHC